MAETLSAVFRVDASLHIGTGHVMRCLTLADALRSRGLKPVFICRALEGNLIDFIVQREYEVYTLPKDPEGEIINRCNDSLYHSSWLETTWEKDAEETLVILKKISPVLLIVDSYALDYRWEKAVKFDYLKILIIDDLADRKHDCDYLVDQNYGRKDYHYAHLVNKECRIFCGSDYCLLRNSFSSIRPYSLKKKFKTDKIKRVLVAMGGVDKDNSAETVLSHLSGLSDFNDLNIKVVCGSSNPNVQSLQEFVDNKQNVKVLIGVENMEELMFDADVAVGAAGSTTWERCAVGLPSLMTVLAENQKVIAEKLVENRVVCLFGLNDEPSFYEAWKELQGNYKEYSRKCSEVTSGEGVFMLCQHLFPIFSKDGRQLELRDAIEEDKMLLYQWQSNPETRKFARDKKNPSLDDHSKWLSNVLKDPCRRLMLLLAEGIPVSCIRLDWKSTSRAEISLYLNPEEYGKGLGYESLSIIKSLYPSLDIEAFVYPENKVSLRLFAKAGYVSIGKNLYRNKGRK